MMILILVSSSIWISAAHDPYCYYMDNKLAGAAGLSNRTYYIDNSIINAGLQDEAISAAKSWVTATKNNDTSKSRVGLTKTSSSVTATIQIRAKAGKDFPASIKSSLGYVVYYSGSEAISTPGGLPTKNWTNCIVYVKTGLSDATAKRTICHEIGHALGLLHPFYPGTTGKSIMLPDNTAYPAYKANTPTSADANMLDMLY